jgi:putative peptide zinc metalloprotease protein
MHLAPEVRWRISKRGLLLAAPRLDAMILDHPHASDLPAYLATDPDRDDLTRFLGADHGQHLVDDLVEVGLLCQTGHTSAAGRPAAAPRRVAVTRSGVEVDGIAGPARRAHAVLAPMLRSWPCRLVLAAVIAVGAVALLTGPPEGPLVSAHPITDAAIGLLLTLALAAAHEFGHAVTLVHYGGTPRRAGFGFYWGAISFYVDSSDALTLSRRARVIQALAGLAVDVVTVCGVAILAHVAPSALLAGVFWRVALLGATDIAVNLLPLLQLDGHWALADYLDEPDLAARARAALGRLLRGGRGTNWWLPLYGAASLTGGLALVLGSGYIWWTVVHDLLTSLFTGNFAEIVVGVLLVGPTAIGLLMSIIGMISGALRSR